MTWVVDASPLLFLAKLDRLHLLSSDTDVVLIPDAVWEEIRALRDPASRIIAETERKSSWLRRASAKNRATLRTLRLLVDAGEAEVLTLAQEVDAARVVLDDLDARRVAHRLSLKLIGTVGLLLAAKLRGDLPSLGARRPRRGAALRRAGPGRGRLSADPCR